jgi:hypothetical protein
MFVRIPKNGLDVQRWGPTTWHTIHAFAHAYDPSRNGAPEAMRAFVTSLGALLPCPACGSHFQSYMQTHFGARHLADKASLIQLFNDAHNDVNHRQGKPVFSLENHYTAFHGTNSYTFDVIMAAVAWASMAVLACTLLHPKRVVWTND